MAYQKKQHQKKQIPFGSNEYEFNKNEIVVIKHKQGGHIRIVAVSNEVDGKGGIDVDSQWMAELDDSGKGTSVMFKSCKTGKYLRINEEKTKWNASGNGDKYCKFKVKSMNGFIKLESAEFAGHCLGCIPGNKVMVGGGGQYSDMKLYTK